MSTDTGQKSDEPASEEAPAKRSPLSDEQRRWIGEITAEIKKERNEPPRPAGKLSPRARAGVAAAAAGA